MGEHVVCFAKWVISGIDYGGAWVVRIHEAAHSSALNPVNL
jgi:hypothetical protein